MRFCKNHPDREAYIGRKCIECFRSDQIKHQNKYYQKTRRENWDEVNIPTLKTDAKIMSIKNLAIRYRVGRNTIRNKLKKLGLQAKVDWGEVQRHKEHKERIAKGFSMNFDLEIGDVLPKFSTKLYV